jgi:hypothetical protein
MWKLLQTLCIVLYTTSFAKCVQCPIPGFHVYIVDVPQEFNIEPLNSLVALLERRLGKFPADPLAPESMFSHQLFEVYLHRWISVSPCRTANPDQATVFFIPFYPYAFTRFAGCLDVTSAFLRLLRHIKATQEVFWERFCGSDHVMPVNLHGNKRQFLNVFDTPMMVVKEIDDLYENPFRLRQYFGLQSRTVLIPYIVNSQNSFTRDVLQDSTGDRPILLSFVGTTLGGSSRKGDVRAKVRGIMQGEPDCRYTELGSRFVLSNIKEATSIYRQSVFCMIPRGDTPNSKRLYDSMYAGCIPLVLSSALQLPYQCAVNYSEVLVQLPERFLDDKQLLLSTIRSN